MKARNTWFNMDNLKKYNHIFFDLDNTLWDFETNSSEALRIIFEEENLAQAGISSFEEFQIYYKPINDRYWARYHHGAATKEQVRVNRFRDTLLEFDIDNPHLAERMASKYLEISPRMTALFPDALDVLAYLQKKYALHLITNGFAEVQWVKVEQAGLRPFFEHIIISEEVGTQKPNKEIFELAVTRASANKSECLMIGDNFKTDILGAKNAGLDQVFFNPGKERVKESVTYVITSLKELKQIL